MSDTPILDVSGEMQTAADSSMRELVAAFGMRAEWLGDHVFDFFRAPAFFPQLESAQTCVLKGGRGTGKTTLLKCLSYQGRYALGGRNDQAIRRWDYFGLYMKVNTNRVTAFVGTELSDQRWSKLFAHYLNLEFVLALTEFFQWYQRRTGTPLLPEASVWEDLSLAFSLDESNDLVTFRSRLQRAQLRFEAQVNNIGDQTSELNLSMLGAPLDLLCERLAVSDEFAGKKLFFLVDEYENLLDYQQQIFNTLVKHATSTYTFKLGVKELGFRVRTTINAAEQLNSPADYFVLDIAEKLRPRFQAFAQQVCESRLATLFPTSAAGANRPITISYLLPGLADEKEASRLGIKSKTAEARRQLVGEGATSRLLSAFDALTPLRQYFCVFWATSHELPISDVVKDRLGDRESWERRFGNYRYSILFSLKRDHPGRRKFYAGWPLLCRLASGNVRYLLELVVSSLSAHLEKGQRFGIPVEPETQTTAAQSVGKKNLQELEGLSDYGASLTKLLLGMGRVLGLLAAYPEGHAPEITQFYLPALSSGAVSPDEREHRALRLLDAAVDSQALQRFTGTKAQADSDTQAYDFMIHPIFSPFFEISYRRKRKLLVTERELLGLIDHPKWAINTLIERHNRRDVLTVSLPEQLRLFESYYGADAR